MAIIWKPIKGYEGLYEISTLGGVKSLPKKVNTLGASKNGYTINRKEKILKQVMDSFGYLQSHLQLNKKQKKYLTHRLVAINFIPNPLNKPCVNHKNGKKTDNRVENLEWVTHSENSIHSFKIGLQCNKGENHPTHKITNEIVKEIRQKYIPYKYSSHRLAKEYNLSKTNILDIIHKRIWSHI